MGRDRKLRDFPLILDHLNRKLKKMLLNRNEFLSLIVTGILSQYHVLGSNILNI